MGLKWFYWWIRKYLSTQQRGNWRRQIRGQLFSSNLIRYQLSMHLGSWRHQAWLQLFDSSSSKQKRSILDDWGWSKKWRSICSEINRCQQISDPNNCWRFHKELLWIDCYLKRKKSLLHWWNWTHLSQLL